MDWDHTVQDAETIREADPDPPDVELIERVRDGDLAAFDPLYRRHAACALRHAHYWTRTEATAEDLRDEAFTRALTAIRRGSGPTEAMLPYLDTVMRRIAGEWARSERRLSVVTQFADLATPELQGDSMLAAQERSLAAVAFAALPERWQSVLWHTEVKGQRPTQLVAMLGIEAGAVAALAYRAREGLRSAYLQAHITEIGDVACQPYALRLGVYARGRVGQRERARLCAHLRRCVACGHLYAMVKYVNGQLGAVTRPVAVRADGTGVSALIEVFVQMADTVVDKFNVTEFLLAQRGVHQSELLADELQQVLTSRLGVEQAKGMLAERGQISVEAAFALMREHARCRNLRLSDLAHGIIQGSISTAELLRGPHRGHPEPAMRESS
jgi:RNA polymerase sigma factor (sigma-70 family)